MIPMKLSGIYAAIPTPFDHNGEIYRIKVEHNLSRWNQTSLAGYVVGSSAGEGPLLAFDEKVLLWELAAKGRKEGRTLIADVQRCLERDGERIWLPKSPFSPPPATDPSSKPPRSPSPPVVS
jgi:hypothetical protein